jgi:hypothetical protein
VSEAQGTAGLQIALPMAEIAAFCARWQITEFALFGSVLREDFGPESDVDVLVTFAEGTELTFDTYLNMKNELRYLFSREIDLLNRRTLERSHNYLRRQAILGTARRIYEA